MDSLDGWVAIKPNAFEEPDKFRLVFIVCWNEIESKFAVTCHNRTLQLRQRRQSGGGQEDEEDPCTSWAGIFSVRELQLINQQLSGVCEELKPCFPALPVFESSGTLWSLIFPVERAFEGTEEELEATCRNLESYFKTATELCGRSIVLDSLFAEDQGDIDQYFENLHEFRKQTLEDRVTRAKEELRSILHQHKHANKMVDLMKVYEKEDEVYQNLVTVATEFYQYLLQPFRDMRELAVLYKLEILKSLKIDDLGPKRIEALEKDVGKWSGRAEQAVSSIQDVTVNYFRETVKALAAMKKQMEMDEKRFGQTAWAAAVRRLEKLKSMLAKETLQHMRARELCLNHKRVEIQRSMEKLTEQNMDAIDQLEIQYYETQLELYDVQFEILKHEERLLITQLDSIRRQIKEKEEEVIYYDTCEDPDELQGNEPKGLLHHPESAEMKTLNMKAQRLESKRGNICARRAYLRNKRDQCEETQKMKLQQVEKTMKEYHQHHSIQIKRNKKKEEDQKKKEFVVQERQRTLQRLLTFKEKCPSQFVLKTSRSQPQSLKVHQDLSHRPLSPSIKSSQTPCMQPKVRPRSKVLGRGKPRSALVDVPVQIFVSPNVPKDKTFSDGLIEASRNVFPPPPPLPPPPPPPPLPPPLPFSPKAISQPLLPDPSLKTFNKPSISEGLSGSGTEARLQESGKNVSNHYSGSMDEILASLKRGEILLRKVQHSSTPATDTGPRDSILSSIRQGVKLRKVVREDRAGSSNEPECELERSFKAALKRIKQVSADSEDEEMHENKSGEWDT